VRAKFMFSRGMWDCIFKRYTFDEAWADADRTWAPMTKVTDRSNAKGTIIVRFITLSFGFDFSVITAMIVGSRDSKNL